MNAKTSEENIHATQYLQGKPIVNVDPNVLVQFSTLPFPSCSKNPSMPHPLRVLQETLSVEEGERERTERELQN